ncbi:MAG: type II secretion system protein M [Granulosicoccaceae bacterium]|jgi:general secretion pathway protein M
MKQWWAKLNSRERRTVLAGAAMLAVLMLYLLAWEPLLAERARLTASVDTLRSDHSWMQKAASELKQLRGSGAVATQRFGSLLGVINSTAQPVLKDAVLKRVEEDRDNSVRVWIEAVAFDDLVLWLGDLQRRYGITASSISAERLGKPGRVNARLILQAPR